MGQIWWNCDDDVWGRFGGIVKTMCRQSWCNFEGGVWGRVGGIVKVVCGADLVEF